jgi:pilus assembly protein CpaE
MRVLIISNQLSFRQQTQAACLRIPDQTLSVRTAESIGLGLDLALQIEAELVFVDLTKNIEASMLAIEDLSKISNRIVVVSADKLNAEIITRAIRSGAREVLSQPVVDEEIVRIIAKTQEINGEIKTQPARNGKVIMCFSSKGGVGKTTLACNIAVTLQNLLGGHRVALIDANTQAPNISPMLDLRPTRWLRDAILEYKRLDSELIKELMTEHSSGLHVLAHSSEDPLGLDFSEDQLSKILLVSKGTYEWTVVDTFPLLSSLNLSLMDLSDEIVLVTEAVVPALRSARYNLEMLTKAGYGDNKLRVALNRYSNYKGNVAIDLVSETLNWPIKTVIPYDSSVTIAANTGNALVEMFPDKAVSIAITNLVDNLIGKETTPLSAENFIERHIRQFKNWLAA